MKKSTFFIPPETRYELKLFKKLQDLGFKVLHNEKLHGFYPDLFLVDYNLIIEVDGGIHRLKSRKKHDKKRTLILESYGYKVIRFTNAEVVRTLPKCIENIESIVFPQPKTPNIEACKSAKIVKTTSKKKQRKKTNSNNSSAQRLVNNLEWQEAACRKLGIVSKPKRVVLEL
jgi:very-short-patch-repair endonuclease